MKKSKKRFVYMDYAATTPLDGRVLKKMLPYYSQEFGNPSNLYELGRNAKNAVTEATNQISKAIGSRADEIIFTGSATEADNLALLGVIRANKDKRNKVIVSSIEHKGILALAESLSKEGIDVVQLKVDKYGLVNLEELKKELNSKTILVSITCCDSETGTLQPLKEITKIISDFRKLKMTSYPYFHTDASQALAYLDLNVNKMNIDLMTLSAHKVYGPKGIGALYVKRGVAISPIIYGGGQQNKVRSGTENVPGIVGFGEAVSLAVAHREKESRRLFMLRNRLERGILNKIPKVVVNGHPKNRLPGFLNVSILDIEGEALLLYLDEKEILVNTGSACNSQSLEPSYILSAMGQPYEYIHGSLRFTLGKETRKADIDYVLDILPPIVEKLRKMSPLNLDIEKDGKSNLTKAFVGNQTPHFMRKKKDKKLENRE